MPDSSSGAPGRCPACKAVGTVHREQRITGTIVRVLWCCNVCGHAYPAEERREFSDRRQKPRGRDRRSKPKSKPEQS
jgi:hypothetical protein